MLRPTLPVFEGHRYENPEKFLEKMEGRCVAERLPPEEWAKAMADQFRCDAYRWYEQYKYFNWSYETLRNELLARFNSDDMKAKLQAELSGSRQGIEEGTAFVSKKVVIYQRLKLPVRESDMVLQIKTLLKMKPGSIWWELR